MDKKLKRQKINNKPNTYHFAILSCNTRQNKINKHETNNKEKLVSKARYIKKIRSKEELKNVKLFVN